MKEKVIISIIIPCFTCFTLFSDILDLFYFNIKLICILDHSCPVLTLSCKHFCYIRQFICMRLIVKNNYLAFLFNFLYSELCVKNIVYKFFQR